MEAAFAFLGVAAFELALFAGAGFLLLGLSDLAVDLLWIARSLGSTGAARDPVPHSVATNPGRLAIFVPAWDEAAVIGDMLCASIERFGDADYRIYVGCYVNDPETIAAVRRVDDLHVRLVIGDTPGPTTKADCLNRLWIALGEDELADGRPAKAIVLHDAEDVVHSEELRLFDRMIGEFDLVQIPVLPLVDPNSRWIAGHYIDEFAEAHAKELVVREAIGASLPSAGVGCAISRDALAWIAALSGGAPFDRTSMTEDYELGLKLHMLGGRVTFVRLPSGSGLVVTRGYFPATIRGAVRQKARWTAGIALSGWDRLGWSGGVAEHWMRLRDRQSLLAALLLLAGYAALLLWVAVDLGHRLIGTPAIAASDGLAVLLAVNLALLGWRLVMRVAFVTRSYGWREGVRAIPRVMVGNLIAMMAAWRAIGRYRGLRRGVAVHWARPATPFPPRFPPNDRLAAAPVPGGGRRRMGVRARRDHGIRRERRGPTGGCTRSDRGDRVGSVCPD